MKNRIWAFAIPAVILLAVFLVPSLLTSQSAVMDKPSKEDVAHKMQSIQIPFVANNGQVDKQVKFYAKTFGGTVFVTKEGEIVYSLPNNSSSVETQCLASLIHSPSGISPLKRGTHPLIPSREGNGVCNTTPIPNDKNETHPRPLPYRSMGQALLEGRTGIALREQFVGAKVKTIQGEEKSVTKVNYFKGSDPEKWKTNISTYDVVSLGEVYDGIELKLKAYGNNVEKLFCVKSGANPEQIKISLSGIQPSGNPPPLSPSVRGTGGCPPLAGAGGGLGARGLWVNEHGELVAETEFGPVKFTKPIAYQEINGKRVDVEVEYVVRDREPLSIQQTDTDNGHDSRSYCFTVASYDKSHDLIIDPLLASTYLGGSGYDEGKSLTLDTSGNVYVTGYTSSTDFPTTSGAYDTSYNGYDYADVFVSKLDGELTTLLASTYLGGSGGDECYSLTLDTSGNVYVTGTTTSTDFPTTSGAYDTSNGGGDVFVSKLNGGLTSLLASTFLGPDGTTESGYGSSLALDTSGNVYVTGSAGSNLPTTSGAYDTSFNGGHSDVFVSKLNGGLTRLLASTYLGGSGYDYGYSLALDTSGNVYVTGRTYSTDFPTTSGAYDTSFNDNGRNEDDDYYGEVFISKLDGELTSLLASTFMGGSSGETGYSLTLDTSGDVYVTGNTQSTDFPTTSGAYDTSQNGYHDVFISKLDSGLTSLLASTYLGGGFANSLALDTSGNVYVTGWTTDFPTTSGAYDTSVNDGDVFVSKLDSGLTSLLASTYLGGSGYDEGKSLTLDTSGNVYVTGYTSSTDFPTTSGAYDTSFNSDSNGDIFVSKLDSNLSSAPNGSITINSGDTYATSTVVTLTLSATDGVGVTGYYISENSTTPSASSPGWTSINTTVYYSASISYTLSIGDGSKTVYVWYKVNSGNISSAAKDSIILDTTTPAVTITSPTSNDKYSTTNSVIALGGSASDSTSGVSIVTWKNEQGGNGAASGTTNWLTSSVSLLLGENVITVTATDGAGNTGVDTITVNLTEGGQGSISGYVVDIGGNPVENAKVSLKGKKVFKKTVSDEDGLFEFLDLDAGRYVIKAIKKGYKRYNHTIRLKEGEETEIEIEMKKISKRQIKKLE